MTTVTCPATVSDQFRCPRKWEIWQQIMSLLPRGRAWQTHESGAERIVASEPSVFGQYEIGSTGLGAEPVVERLTVLQLYWATYAEVLEYFHQRACALVDEFFCSTLREMVPEWGAEYGFPDACEPWDTLCDKVRAQGGATCAYLASLAARLGWKVECFECEPGGGPSADCLVADCSTLCECIPNIIYIRVLTAESPAFTGRLPPFAADALVADCTTPCVPVPDGVFCLIERFKPAHVKAIYEVI